MSLRFQLLGGASEGMWRNRVRTQEDERGRTKRKVTDECRVVKRTLSHRNLLALGAVATY